MLEPLVESAGPGVEAELISTYPALALPAGSDLAQLTKTLTGAAAIGAVSFGTEAGLFQQAGIPSIICGPGDISRAHKPEEYLTRAELNAARNMILKLGQKLAD